MTSEFQLRNVFNDGLVNELAAGISRVWKPFDRKGFVGTVVPGLQELNFGARSSLIANALKAYLPEDFEVAAQILIDALGPEPDTDSLSGFEGFIVMPQCLFIGRYGLDHFDVSINVLYEMTKRFTAEGDIRPFIKKYPKKTLRFLHRLTEDESPFARRLASEGTRPRLPLSSRLPAFQKDPTPVIAILEKLKSDPNLMVRRSVANNLNDIAKDNPDIVVSTLERWQRRDASSEMAWLVSHALRTLLKSGHTGALKLLGYDPDVRVAVSVPVLSDMKPKIGDAITFSFEVKSREDKQCQLMIDYIVYFMKSSGKQAPKTFKAAKKSLKPGETALVTQKQSFMQRSTRVHYPGEHGLEVQINGRGYGKVRFVVQQ